MLACFSDSFMKEKGKWDKGGMGLKGMRRLPRHQFGHQRRRWPTGGLAIGYYARRYHPHKEVLGPVPSQPPYSRSVLA